MRDRHLIDLVEWAYRLDLSESAWLDGLTGRVASIMEPPHGLLAYTFDASAPTSGVQIGSTAAVDVERWFMADLEPMLSATPTALRDGMHPRGILCETMTGHMRRRRWSDAQLERFWRELTARGYVDSGAIVAGDVDGYGVLLAAPLRQAEWVALRDKRAWMRVAVHIAAGHRLRRALLTRPPVDGAEAILEPSGQPAHLEGAATNATARAALRRAVRRLEEARHRQHEPMEALELWEGLVAGRWSLVDHFDSDGRRFLVAVKNDPALPDPRRLTLRERQVTTFAAQGHDNALIAYELGLTPSTVANHLSRALTKLGMTSRTDLILLHQQLVGPTGDPDDGRG